MSDRSVVLASSPVIGPLAMHRLATALGCLGVDARTPSAPPVVGDFVDAVAASCPAERPFVLAGFSAAGPRLFAVADRTGPEAIVFVDARLPVDGVAPTAEPALRELLARLPVDAGGFLPPWPRWWPDAALVALCPDDDLRDRFVAECPPVPRSMYDEPVDAPAFSGPCAFLGFGDGYADQRALADERGWPTSTLAHHRHLAPLVAPDEVARSLVSLCERMGVW